MGNKKELKKLIEDTLSIKEKRNVPFGKKHPYIDGIDDLVGKLIDEENIFKGLKETHDKLSLKSKEFYNKRDEAEDNDDEDVSIVYDNLASELDDITDSMKEVLKDIKNYKKLSKSLKEIYPEVFECNI